jgi:23S rRNA (uracil1939-C5)-methyltransferase
MIPFCKHFGVCGGCKFQDVQPQDYAQWKRDNVVKALEHVRIDAPVANLIDAHGKGRRRAVFHVREIDGIWIAGFMQARSHDLVAIDVCPVLTTALHRATEIAASFGPQLGPCDVAFVAADNGLDVAVKAGRDAVGRRLPALRDIFAAHAMARLSVNGQALFTAVQPVIHMGKASVPLPINGFLQATREGEDVLAGLVAKSLRKAKRIADLFCGVGPIALRLAERAHIHAVDSDKPAIDALQAAVRAAQGLKPITTEVRDLFRHQLVPLELKEFDAVVLDPPRAGADAQVRSIVKSKLKQVIYVSCDAHTFARDAATLTNGGFRLTQVTPVDQFKWTSHVEIVAEFLPWSRSVQTH